MKTRLAVASLALLLMAPSSWGGGQEPAQQGPGQGHGLGGMGMMGGWGGGMMGRGWGALDLTKDQRNKMYAIHRDLREKQFALMDRMHDNMESVSFYRDGKFDEQAARNAYAGAEKIHRQMFENMLDARKRADALLTPQQRQQLSQASR
jgi:Spy/CpxP family protein refolding chaperone